MLHHTQVVCRAAPFAKRKDAPVELPDGDEESEDAGEVPGTPSSDYGDLCAELGDWIPLDASSGGPRTSPLFVEAYFASLDQSAAQSAAQISPPAAAPTIEEPLSAESRAGGKRPLDEESSDEEAAPGPSWRVAGTRAPRGGGHASSPQVVHPGSSGPKASSQPGLEPLTPDQASHPLFFRPPISSPVSHSLHIALAHQLAASTSASADVATSSSAGPVAGLPQPQRLEGGGSPQHFFVRLPTLQPGVTARPFMPSAMRSGDLVPRRQWNILHRMWALFKKEQLDDQETQNLVYLAEKLASHAYHTMQERVDRLSPYAAVTRLGRAFLTLLHLLYASQVLKQNWPSHSWWGELMRKIAVDYFYAWDNDGRISPFQARLANDLSAASKQLKSGVFPPARVVDDLKRRLFGMPWSPATFKDKVWDPWRQDDEKSPPGNSRRL
ncbi:hypothetical protein ACSSS7_002673 [Eimeria intestinalis]